MTGTTVTPWALASASGPSNNPDGCDDKPSGALKQVEGAGGTGWAEELSRFELWGAEEKRV